MTDDVRDRYIEYDNRDAVTCWPKGFYKAELWKTELTKSKEKTDPDTGEIIPPRDMLEVIWKVWNGRQTQLISDYVIPGTATIRKLKDMAKAFGERAKEEFKRNAFQPADYETEKAVLLLTVEENEEYGDRNKVSAFKPASWRPGKNELDAGYAMPDFMGDLIGDQNHALERDPHEEELPV